jgi:hypothetical protein
LTRKIGGYIILKTKNSKGVHIMKVNKWLNIGIMVFFLISCGDGAGSNPESDSEDGPTIEWGNPIPFSTPPQGKGLYTAGYYNKGTDIACYWKTIDNITLQKDLMATNSSAYDIFVTDNGVYIAGDFDSRTNRKPCYWFDNGTTITHYPLTKPTGAGNTYSKAITVTESGVYAAGYYDKSGFIACYWDASGVCHDLPLPSGAKRSYALSMSVTSDGTIYIAGYYRNNNDLWRACYWKVSDTSIERKDIDSERYSYALDIAVTSTGVFIAGYYEDYSNWRTPCYWIIKGDTITRHDLKGNGEANTIAVNATGLYVAGFYSNIVSYWDTSGDEPYKLEENNSHSATGIVVSSTGNIFVAGLYDKGFKEPNACYWGNQGIRHDFISNDFYSDYMKSYAESMILVE